MTNLLEGLLWFDNDPKRDWRDKVRAAAAAHEKKFWIRPDVCHVKPATVGRADEGYVETVDGIEVYARDGNLTNDFFVARRFHARGTGTTQPKVEAQPELFTM